MNPNVVSFEKYSSRKFLGSVGYFLILPFTGSLVSSINILSGVTHAGNLLLSFKLNIDLCFSIESLNFLAPSFDNPSPLASAMPFLNYFSTSLGSSSLKWT